MKLYIIIIILCIFVVWYVDWKTLEYETKAKQENQYILYYNY